MRTADNSVVLNLHKVQWGRLLWVNQWGGVRSPKPKEPTTYGTPFNPDEAAASHAQHPNETMMERAVRLDILDVWTPEVVFQLAANHNVKYRGKKALAMWKAWQSHVFAKHKKKGKK